MPLTKSKAIEAFIHVLDNDFEAPVDGCLSKALEHAGYNNIWDLITLYDEDIESLTYDKEKEKMSLWGELIRACSTYSVITVTTRPILVPIGDD